MLHDNDYHFQIICLRVLASLISMISSANRKRLARRIDRCNTVYIGGGSPLHYTQPTMIHTDKYYSQPTVFKLTTCLHDKYIQLDTHGNVSKMQSITGKIRNTFMRAVSYVSNDAAIFP